MTLSLPEKVLALSDALGPIPHAFGGAISLAYYAEPRATTDIDVNVFVEASEFDRVRSLLAPLGVDLEESEATGAGRDGLAAAWFAGTRVDLFFSYDEFHAAAARDRRQVEFGDGEISILSPEHLVVCKVVFDRRKDWIDIDSMRADGTHIDTAEVLRWVGRIVGDTDRRYDRIAAVLTGP